MGYLTLNDYLRQIQTDNLNQILSNNDSIRISSEAAAQEELASYLVQKYDMAHELSETSIWSYSVAYNAESRIYLDAIAYLATNTYALHTLTLSGGNIYICTSAITIPEVFTIGHWTLIGQQYQVFYGAFPNPKFDYYTNYLTGNVVWYKGKNYTATKNSVNTLPDDVNLGAMAWGSGVAYSIAAGTLPTNALWVSGDNRAQQIVMNLIDITLFHLHSRIAPRNIPELREKRYDNAISWLKMCAKGYITPTNLLTRIQPFQGSRMRFGGDDKKINTY